MASISTQPAAAVALLIALAAPEAHAYATGIAAAGCSGCHNGGAEPTITIDVNPRNPGAGETVTLDVAISTANGDVGGFYLRTGGRGRLVAVDGQGTRVLADDEMTHTAPRRASGGAVRFQARWVAPDTPGGVVVEVFGISANGNGRPSGDGASTGKTSFAYGCSGTTYYMDYDEDGYGRSSDIVVDCEQRRFYATMDGDCDQNDPEVHPGHEELCNSRDDDCDGEIDEDLEVRAQYEDADGDGHGTPEGETVMAKCPPPGFAPDSRDCNDGDPLVYPGATETCNYLDDNCDGDVDEKVREICGVGMCAREAYACIEGACTPGEPTDEVCNALDDDCDGQVDEEPGLCGAGQACKGGECVADGGSADADAGGDGSGSACAVGAGTGAGAGAAAAAAGVLLLFLRRRRAPKGVYPRRAAAGR